MFSHYSLQFLVIYKGVSGSTGSSPYRLRSGAVQSSGTDVSTAIVGFAYPDPGLLTSTPPTPTRARIAPSNPDIESILTVGLVVYPDPPEVTCTSLSVPEVRFAFAIAPEPNTDPR